ncbi:septal ring lytic transglycosylase RlpA family protein [Marinicella sp. S1101]|uniref:septal ring lytic transglycosylase RlpA family protein n=1 Tax=Marinicella marina TaxID=2996016 RepID=UPI002260F2B8|nr:septal ring lytic transglycosylase RlpA family protein [Marinicella marina]MCX7552521.1 septal ring lytic transglycosylase RlpA family protein [Marinicella marina]MDJ1139397.1 septal ring lytic transglycosylase RlpA family protein [Marinicella marina]
MNRYLIVMLLSCLVMVGCGKKDRYRDIDTDKIKPWVPKAEPLSRYGNHSPYRVHGKVYQVMAQTSGYTETGQASWYGKKFHGRQTSNQEVFDMYKLTAAHKTLPLPSYVEVTNLKNDKKVIVRVNDRGPFIGDRIIDLSYAAAKALDFINDGIADVHIRVVNSPKDLVNVPIKQGLTYLQLGAFSDKNSAYNLARKVSQILGIETFVTILSTSSGALHRVRIGPIQSENKVNQLMNQVTSNGIPNAKVITE